MNAFFFIPAGITLATIAALRISKSVVDIFVINKTIVRTENAADELPARRSVETIAYNGYILFGLLAGLSSGFFVGSWTTLLLSGHLWFLISR